MSASDASSISAYYYSGAVSAFTGGLIAMALFLFAYRGYENNYGLRDRCRPKTPPRAVSQLS